MANTKTFNKAMTVTEIYELCTEIVDDLEYAHTHGYLNAEGEGTYRAYRFVEHESFWYTDDNDIESLMYHINEEFKETLYRFETYGKEYCKEELKIYKKFIEMFG